MPNSVKGGSLAAGTASVKIVKPEAQPTSPSVKVAVDDTLHTAALEGEPSQLSALLATGADPNLALSGGGQTPLHYACKRGQSANVSVLLGAKADPNFTDSSGQTPLHIAASRVDMEVVRVLLEGGADATLKDHEDQLPVDQLRDVDPFAPGGDSAAKNNFRDLEMVSFLLRQAMKKKQKQDKKCVIS